MSAGGGAPKRVSFGDGSYSTPVWSPRGDLIAFTKRKGGNFAIGIMKTMAAASAFSPKVSIMKGRHGRRTGAS